MNLKRNTSIVCILALAGVGLFCSITSSPIQTASAVTPLHYDGKHAMMTFWFDHAYKSQLIAMNNMTNLGLPCGILDVYERVGSNDVQGFMTWDQIKQKQADGCELVSHSWNHTAITPYSSQSDINLQVVQSLQALEQVQGEHPTGYVSPFDAVTNQSFATIAENFKWSVVGGAKTNTPKSIANDGYLRYGTHLPTLHHDGIGNGNPLGTNFTYIKGIMDTAIKNHGYLILNAHQLDDSGLQGHVPPHLAWQIIQYMKQQQDAGNVTITTPCNALNLC